MKIYKWSSLGLVAIVALVGCRMMEINRSEQIEPTPNMAQTSPTGHAVAKNAIELTLDDYATIELAARAGFGDWLGSYLDVETSPAYRLKDYRITKFETVSDQDSRQAFDQVFLIEYSVLPRFEPSHWIAGDGRYGEEGWIIDKRQYVGIHTRDGSVYLSLLGACFLC